VIGVTAMWERLLQIRLMRELRFGFIAVVIGVFAFALAVLTLVLPEEGNARLLHTFTWISLLTGVAALLMAMTAAFRRENKRLYLAAVGFAIVTILIPFVFAVLSLFGGALILVAVVGAVVSCAF